MTKKITFDPEKFQLSLAELKTHGKTFQVVIDSDLYVEYKDGKIKSVLELIKSDKIFADAQKGLLAGEVEIESVFKELNREQVIEKILGEGAIHLPLKFKQMLREKKRNQIISILHTNCVDPRTGHPHTRTRIETALDESKIKIDEFTRPSNQVQSILKKLKEIIPIRFEQKELNIHIPVHYSAQTFGIVQKLGDCLSHSWNTDGSLSCKLVIPGGLEEDVFRKLNEATQGTVEIEITQTISK